MSNKRMDTFPKSRCRSIHAESHRIRTCQHGYLLSAWIIRYFDILRSSCYIVEKGTNLCKCFTRGSSTFHKDISSGRLISKKYKLHNSNCSHLINSNEKTEILEYNIELSNCDFCTIDKGVNIFLDKTERSNAQEKPDLDSSVFIFRFFFFSKLHMAC